MENQQHPQQIPAAAPPQGPPPIQQGGQPMAQYPYATAAGPPGVPAHAAGQYAPAQFQAYSPATPVTAGLQPGYNQVNPIQMEQAPYVPRIDPMTGRPYTSVWRDRHDEEKKKTVALEAQVAAEIKAKNDLYQELLAARAETAEAKRATEFEKKLAAVKGSQSEMLVNGALVGVTPKKSKAVHFDEEDGEVSSPDLKNKKKRSKKNKKKGKRSKYSSSDSSASDSECSSQGDTTLEDTKKRRRKGSTRKAGRGSQLTGPSLPPAGGEGAAPAVNAKVTKMSVAQVGKKFKTELAKMKLRLVLVKFQFVKPEDAEGLSDEKAVELAAQAHRDAAEMRDWFLEGERYGTYVLGSVLTRRTYVGKFWSGKRERLTKHFECVLKTNKPGGKKLYGGLRAKGVHNYFMLPLGLYKSKRDCNADEKLIITRTQRAESTLNTVGVRRRNTSTHRRRHRRRRLTGRRRGTRRTMWTRACGAEDRDGRYSTVKTEGYNGGSLNHALWRLSRKETLVEGCWEVNCTAGGLEFFRLDETETALRHMGGDGGQEAGEKAMELEVCSEAVVRWTSATLAERVKGVYGETSDAAAHVSGKADEEAVDDRGVQYSAEWGVGFSWQLEQETRGWVQSFAAERRVLTKFEALMRCDVTAGMLLQQAGGELMRAVGMAEQTQHTGGIASLTEYRQIVGELKGLARGTLDRNTAVGFGVCEKVYQEWLRKERDGGNYERVGKELRHA
ncbi:hypothetical protein CYMTET_35144 [Cymbomonas tetramitiformis]|uniref:Uncharacterized protein n=1 Tax=Cymbomonas tetramitiformis TaxID=36881 RepID=A0AAE0F9Q6_9CHLO|nr:hypothetical protein CYMTET_35144 [Cymbomonas tetramitiformis]